MGTSSLLDLASCFRAASGILPAPRFIGLLLLAAVPVAYHVCYHISNPGGLDGMDTPITDDIKTLLRKCSVATLSTQLFKRGLRHTVMQGVRPLSQGPEPMVGEAFTVRFIPAREDLDHVGVFARGDEADRKSPRLNSQSHSFIS